MSRKRSEAAIRAYHDRFVQGAQRTHGVGRRSAERVYQMIVGFSGFGFPKAHGAAFGLLAYQSTWLRVHYAPEFLCALLDEQPMGFYPPDSLVHEAQRRGITVLPPDVNASRVGCTVEDLPEDHPVAEPPPAYAVSTAGLDGRAGERRALDPVAARSAVRIGLGYVLGVRADEIDALVAAREEGGPFTSSRTSPRGPARAAVARAPGVVRGVRRARGAGGPHAGAPPPRGAVAPGGRGARDAPAGARRGTRADVGGGDAARAAAAAAVRAELPELGTWDAMIADYGTTGVATRSHPVGLLRGELDRLGAVGSAKLGRVPHRARVRVGGLVVARQKPGTAKGIVFMLLEDEAGTINLIVPPDIYDRDRLAVRTEPLVIAEGRLERHPAAGRGRSTSSSTGAPARGPGPPHGPDQGLLPAGPRGARAHDGAHGRQPLAPTGTDGAPSGTDGGDFRAVAPPVMSFAQGRRR
jgi:error-prone DNA polymerase